MNQTNSAESVISPATPKSDSTHLSVQTIIDRYDNSNQSPQSATSKALSQQQLQQQRYQYQSQQSSPHNRQQQPSQQHHQHDRQQYFINSSSGDSDGHLYNTVPDNNNKLKDQVEVFSNEPIIVKTEPQPPPTISNSSSITLIQNNDKQNTNNNQRFSIKIWLGVIQLLLSVTLTALGGLMLARDSTFANTGSGIWAGSLCGIAGALGVINMRKALTGFLVISLICVASSTLALALSGIGLVRDFNNKDVTEGVLTASSGLIIALSLHFLISVISVYLSAINLCSRNSNNTEMLENVVLSKNSAYLSHQRVEQYFKSLPNNNNQSDNKIHKVKIINDSTIKSGDNKTSGAIWTTSTNARKQTHPPEWLPNTSRHHSRQQRYLVQQHPTLLVPANFGNNKPLPMRNYPPHPLVPPQYMTTGKTLPPPIFYPLHLSGHGMIQGPPPPMSYPPPSTIPSSIAHYQHHQHQQQHQQQQQQHQQQHQQYQQQSQTIPTGLMRQIRKLTEDKRSRKQRRKSESDQDGGGGGGKTFVYTGLDRTIANSFLEQQEKYNGSSMDCTSLNETCKDVVM